MTRGTVTAGRVDAGLRLLTRSANKGRLWFGIAAVAALVPGATRRAAIRGAGALAATSFLVNVVLKPIARRKRPLIERTPVVRRLQRAPWTTSFPSGHAASAAAFATGVALEHRAGAAAIAPLAAAVGYSRVHVGVHHVSDVVAGAALGVGVALATRTWWPVVPAEPVLREHAAAPPLPAGKGLVVVVNPKAGNGDDEVREPIRELLPEVEFVELQPEREVSAELGDRVSTARALGVAGGDGTVAAVAAVAVREGLPLAVFPAGTLNHFARDVGIGSFAETAQAVQVGDALAVEVATVNGIPFVNTAVVGAYPDLVRRREALEPTVGRWLATAVAARQVLREHRPLPLTIDGTPTAVWTLFVGNCRYVPLSSIPAMRPRLNDGLLDVSYLRADTPFSRARAVLASLARVRRRSRAHPRRLVTELTVESRSGPVQVARDGEPAERASVLRFGKLPDRLVVYRPDGES
jgi:undecaprenyl-diphosphatase